MVLTEIDRKKILLANCFDDLPGKLKKQASAEFERQLSQANKKQQQKLSPSYNYDQVKPSFVDGLRASESSMLIIDIELLLMTYVAMSALLTIITIGISIVGLISILGLQYYFSRQRQEKEQAYWGNLEFAWLQQQAASQQLSSEIGYVETVDSDYARKVILQRNALPKIKINKMEIVKKVFPTVAISAGIMVTTGFAVPQFLTTLGVITGAVSFATPVGWGILAGLLCV